MEVRLTQNPIPKVLSSMKKNGVPTLLSGGQACVFYGVAELSFSVDLAVAVADDESWTHLESALQELDAVLIGLPPLERVFLERGHRVSLRCQHPECANFYLHLRETWRGAEAFPRLWEKRTNATVEEEDFELLALPDLIGAYKTNSDKNWSVIRRLVEAHFFDFQTEPTPQRIQFWQEEARTPAILLAVARQFPEAQSKREAAILASEGADENAIEAALKREEEREREADRAYWAPLKRELEELRRAKRASGDGS